VTHTACTVYSPDTQSYESQTLYYRSTRSPCELQHPSLLVCAWPAPWFNILNEVHDHLGLIRQASGLQALTRPRRPERPRAEEEEEEEEEEEAIDRLLADEGEGEEDVDRPRAYEGKGKGRDTGC
jgi:hypothetical protein